VIRPSLPSAKGIPAHKTGAVRGPVTVLAVGVSPPAYGNNPSAPPRILPLILSTVLTPTPSVLATFTMPHIGPQVLPDGRHA
jgi:hypothetical protein